MLSIEPRAFHREYSSQVSYVTTCLADVYYIQLHSTRFQQNKKARDFLPIMSASLPPTQPSTHHGSLIRHRMGLVRHDLFQVNPHLSLVTTTSFLNTAHQLFNNHFLKKYMTRDVLVNYLQNIYTIKDTTKVTQR